jgi:hypothetical protein
MTYNVYLNSYGEVVTKTFKELGTTWDKINNYKCSYPLTKEEKLFFERYGLRPTIFNVANLRKIGHIHLPSFFIQVCLEHGAVDKRRNKKCLRNI